MQTNPAISVQKARALAFRNAHLTARPLLVGNAWDGASARILELAGFPAIGTTSAGIAFSRGYADGQQIPADLMVEAVAGICRVASIPVSADVEAGYGNSAEEIERITMAVVQTGAVGMNLEDGTGDPARPLTDLALQLEKLKAAKRTAAKLGIDLVLNARTDAYLYPGPEAQKFKETLRRSQAYLNAGADCIFIIGLLDTPTISSFLNQLRCPINILATAGGPTIKELQELGVARISFGSAPMRAALRLLQGIAIEILVEGKLSTLKECIPHALMNDLMQFPCST